MVSSTVISIGGVDQTARDAATAAQADATKAKITTRTDVKATRLFNTVYQNLTDKVLHVQVVAEDPTNGYTLHMESDSATPPTQLISSEVSISAGESGTVFGMILPNHYYQVTYAGATIVSWYETT